MNAEIEEMMREIRGTKVDSISHAREILENLGREERFYFTKNRRIFRKNKREFVYCEQYKNNITLNLHNACRRILNKEIL